MTHLRESANRALVPNSEREWHYRNRKKEKVADRIAESMLVHRLNSRLLRGDGKGGLRGSDWIRNSIGVGRVYGVIADCASTDRKRVGLTQPQFELLRGVGLKTVTRWPNGTVVWNGTCTWDLYAPWHTRASAMSSPWSP
jgi:hypothetical protein